MIDKNALPQWNKDKLEYMSLIILVITISFFLKSNQITLRQIEISYHQRLWLANR